MIYDVISTYIGKDNRVRAYIREDGKIRLISYPRVLMAEKLGRKLEPYEDVHHKDEDVTNNDIDNLEVVLHGPHQREHSQKYFDKEMICPECNKPFIWAAKQQRYFYSNISRNRYKKSLGVPFCFKSCAGKYGKRVQEEDKLNMHP